MILNAPFRVIEVCNTWPPETFIERHLSALEGSSYSINLVARQNTFLSRSASVKVFEGRSDEKVQPNFDHLSFAGKLLALPYLIHVGSLNGKNLSIRNKVLIGYFSKLKPNLIHFHNAQLAVMMSWVANRLGIPYTISLRGTDVHLISLLSDTEQEKMRSVLQGAKGIHTVCNYLGDKIKPWGIKTTTIYTTVPFQPLLIEYQPVLDGKIHLVTTGRMVWQKNYTSLLRAVRDLLELDVPVHLKIIGSGEEEVCLRYWIQQLGLKRNVELLGKVNESEIFKELRTAHAYVQSSIAEGLSNSMAEAMAMGCPVIATNVGGTNEVIHENETGFLLPATMPELWAERLTVTTKYEVMKSVREKAYYKAREIFSKEKHSLAFIKFFQEALD